jgi:FlaA1/EpsC-like NDP-sugar epimerase
VRVFVTGLTGSLGGAIARLHHSRGDQVFGCARSEPGAVRWHAANGHLGTLLVADAAGLAERSGDVARLLPGVDRVYHCAAMKHVDLCEKWPDEATWQNVVVTSLVAGACADHGVPLVFASTDKACGPSGVYGATKLIAERAVIRSGGAAVRLANLAGSRGSVFETWRLAALGGEPVRVTDPDMTRFFMGIDSAAAFMADRAVFGRVVIPHPLKAARMGDLAEATGCRAQFIGPRPGETRHQWLVASDDPAEEEDDRLVLGVGGRWGMDVSSASAERWDARELLDLGGFFR